MLRASAISKLVIISAFICLALFAQNAAAVTFPQKPAAKDMFTDEANIIQKADQTQINEIAFKLLREQRIPLYVVTIPSFAAHDAAGYTIEQYASELFDHWGIGYKDRNYGILLVVSVADRKARIEFGSDWAHRHDNDAQTIMNTIIIPKFKAGEYSSGILEGVKALDTIARGLALPAPPVPYWFYPAMILLALFVVAIIVSLFKSGRSGWGWLVILALGALLFFLFRSSGSSGSGFGGGSSGGGGASGSW